MARRHGSKAPQSPLSTEELRENFNAVQYEFIQAELDLAITFCEIAASTKDPQKSGRNKMHAEEARKAAKHFLSEDRLNQKMRQEIQGKMGRLERLLSKVQEC
jgi:hypothetical protein